MNSINLSSQFLFLDFDIFCIYFWYLVKRSENAKNRRYNDFNKQDVRKENKASQSLLTKALVFILRQ